MENVSALWQKIGKEFATKPSSIKFHHTEAGGMGRHVKEVMNIALETFSISPDWYNCKRDDVVISTFVHDFNKLGKYKELPMNHWRRQPKYGSRKFEYDNSKISIEETAETINICSRNGLLLTDLQINAITFHHGFTSNKAINNSNAGRQMTPLSVLLHFADMMSIKVFGRNTK